MPVSRVTTTPSYFEYIIYKALVPMTGVPSPALLNLRATNGWIDVPHYQRGISWTIQNMEDFLESTSVLLGNVILSEFPVAPVAGKFPHLPSGAANYLVLVDGLQRLAIGTMLLNALHLPVITTNPQRPADALFFTALSARVNSFAPIYQHNDTQFKNHPRKAIADQYTALAEQITSLITDRLAKGDGQKLAQEVIHTFLDKQIAIDEYHNFTNSVELMNTFLGLNTVRVDLGPVDLLRATIVEKATSSSWTPAEIEEMENEFTGIFTDDEKPKTELAPFVSIILDSLSSNTTQANVFPSWSTGLTKAEVDNFLSFVGDFQGCRGINTYFDEIRFCGSNPYSAVLIHYYKQYLITGNLPSFLTGGTKENAELHKFLVANYRALFGGRIGRTRVFAEKLLNGSILNLGDAADQISVSITGHNASVAPDKDWLRASLSSSDKQRARRIFNAMQLPKRSLGWGTQPFNPLVFGSRSGQNNIDHLIPDSMKIPNQPGVVEINTIRNFSPLPANQNRIAKATSCSTKLGTGGIYDVIISGTTPYHPYCKWLVQTHAPAITPAANLDNQMYLEPNQSPNIGNARLEFITDHLLDKV